MYITSVGITNIGLFKWLGWELGERPMAGWHVVLGDNGSGKSTFLKAISLGILGEAQAVAVIANSLLRESTDSGRIDIKMVGEPGYDDLEHGSAEGKYASVLRLSRSSSGHIGVSSPAGPSWANELLRDWNASVWERRWGWFSAAYGPFRRFTGGDGELERRFAASPELSRHATLFFAGLAIGEALNWLRTLQFRKLETGDDFIDRVIRFINQHEFLPNGVQLKAVTSQGIDFKDANGAQVPIEQLSDGYDSILSLTLDVIRQIVSLAGDKDVLSQDCSTINWHGVVLIDEIDVHLHPIWQRQIGFTLRRLFPNMQFIVTTHSPLVCQAAVDLGSVYRLPTPGKDDLGGFLDGTDLDRLLFGDILDAYSTSAFGAGITRSEVSQEYTNRLAVLNMKSINSSLTNKERAERDRLRAIFGSRSSVLSTNPTDGAAA
jgi:energy-coupling factor transporter ATP-binding protein EcfA2